MALQTCGLGLTKTGPKEAQVGLQQVSRFTRHHIGQVMQALSQPGCMGHGVMPLARAMR